MAAQESEISNFMLRLSGTGTTVGLAEKDIVALSAAMAGVGINAEAGGSAMSKVMSKINTAVMSGGKQLQGFADVAGISGKEFAETWKNDPYEAITLFEKGVKKAVDQGENHKELLGDLGIKELRETDTVLRLANGNKQLADAREHANKGWKEGTALSDEATERYKTLGSQIQLFKNELFALGRSIGSAVAPALVAMMKALTPVMRALSNAPDSVKLLVVALVGIPVIIAPVAFALSGFVAVLGAAATAMEGFAAAGAAGGLGAKVFGKAVTAIKNPVGATKVAVGGLGKGFLTMINPLNLVKGGFGGLVKVLKLALSGLRFMTGPIGLLITGLTLLASGLIKAYKEVDWFRNGVNGAVEIVKVFAKGIGGGLITGIKNLAKWMGDLGNKAKEFGKQWYDSWKNTKVGKERIKEWNSLKETAKNVFDAMAQGNKKATDTSDALGEGVSKGTRKALQKYVDFSEGSIRAIEKIKINGGKLTKESQKELTDSIKQGAIESINAVKKRNKEIDTNLRKALENSVSISEEEKQNIIKKSEETATEKEQKMRKLNKDIAELEEKQYTDGKLTDKEAKLLKSKLEERNRMTIEYVAKGAEEQQAILSRMEANTSGLSNQEISKALKASAKAEKKAIKEAAKIRDEGIKEADRALADGSINKNEHRSIVLDLESDYNDAVDTANKKTKEVQKSVEKGNKGIWKEMNKQGETYTGAQKMWNEFSSAFKKYWGSGDSIKNTLTGWWNGYVETFTNLGNKGVSWIGKGFSSLGSKIGSWWNKGLSETQVSWGILTQKLGTAWESTKQWFVNIGLKMGGAIKEGWSIFTSTIGNWWGSFVTMLSNSWTTTKQWFVNVGLSIGRAIATGWNQSKQLTFTVWTSIWTFIRNIWNWIWNKISVTTTWIWNKIKLVWDWIKNKTIGTYTIVKNFLFNTWNAIWSKIKSTTTWIWNKIKTSWDWVKNKTISAYTIVKNFLFNTWNSIWSKIKNTTTWIWNKIRTSWDWVKNKTISIYTTVRNFIANTWNSIWSKIKNTTTWIWNKIRTTWDNIRSKTSSIFSSVWNTIKNIWTTIWNFLKNTVIRIKNKIVSTWESIKRNMQTMTNSIRNHTVGRFESMYNGAKEWIDKIGGYIDGAKKWMADKASSMGKSVAKSAVAGLNLMIGGINKISKGITGSKLIDPIDTNKFSTGTRKGKPSTNSKGQLRKPTLATVNDKGRGNGKGRNGHQELIIRQGKRIEVPQGKDVVTALDKGDAVVSGAETQSWQAQGIIPQFASGTPGKKKKLIDVAGGEFGKLVGKGVNKADHAMDTVGAVSKASAKVASDKVEDIKEDIGEAMVKIGDWSINAMEYIKNPGKLVSTVMEKMGVDLSGVAGGTGKLARAAYENLKKSLIKRVKEMLEEASAPAGGGYNPFANWTKTPGRGWSPTGHAGIDYAMPTGTKIPSPLDGKVIKVWNSPYGGGNETQVWDGAKYTHIFMHQSKQIAKQGSNIKQGETIGLVGSTGNSSGPHLHWQVNKGKGFRNNHPDSINPEAWVKEAMKASGGSKSASKWRPEIMQAASRMKQKLSGSEISTIIKLINTESGGRAGVTQGVKDVNSGGNEARGLLQYTPATFSAYSVKGHKNIVNGLDQLIAFFNNKNWRRDLASWQARMSRGITGWGPTGPRRFYRGGIIEKDQLVRAGEGNRKEMIIPLTRKTRAMQLIDQAKSMMGVGPDGSINIGDGGNLNDEKLDKLILAIGNLTRIVENKRLIVDGESISDYVGTNQANEFNKKGYFQGKSPIK
ncbi:tail length tape measure protein [Staphylococcus phage PG-2021_4]